MMTLFLFWIDFISDGLVPHLLNQLQDVRCRRLPHRHAVYYAVTTAYGLYAAVSQLFMIFLALGQLDLLLARLFSDLVANLVTTGLYLETKTYDPLALMDPLAPDSERMMMALDAGGGGVGLEDSEFEEAFTLHTPPACSDGGGGGGRAPQAAAEDARQRRRAMMMASAMELTAAPFGCSAATDAITMDGAPLLAKDALAASSGSCSCSSRPAG
jgi:hypothetical protein